MLNSSCSAKQVLGRLLSRCWCPTPSTCIPSRRSVPSTTTCSARHGHLRLAEPLRALTPVWIQNVQASRIHLPASLGSTGITPLQRYYGRSDFSMTGSSCRSSGNEHRHDAMEISLLHVHGLPDHSAANHPAPPRHRFRTLPLSVTGLPNRVQASPFGSRLAADARPNRVRHPADWSFTSCCSPPRLATPQLQSVTGRRASAWGGLPPP